MANFKLDVDADGIALVTWDMPDRSMNVITMDVIAELGAVVEKVAGDAAIKGAVITSGKDAFCGGADLAMLERMATIFADADSTKGEEAAAAFVFEESRKLSLLYRRSKPAASRGSARSTAPPWAAASSSRSPAIIASPPTNPKTRLGLPEIKIGLFPGAGGTQRIARMMLPADALQFLLKGDQLKARPRQGDEADRQCRAGGRSHQGREGLDQGRRQGCSAVGCAGFPAAGRAGLFQGGHDDVPGRQRDLPARDLRQLSGGARHSPGGLRGLAAAVRHRAARRVALVRQDFALAGSGGDDPLAVRLDAGSQQGRAAPAERAADVAEKNRRGRRRLHGRWHRAGQRRRRIAGGADRPRPGNRRQGQGRSAQGAQRPRDQGADERHRARRTAQPHHADARLCRAQGLRPHHRGGVRGPQGQVRRHCKNPGGDRRQRDFRLQHVDVADHARSPPNSRIRRASSAFIFSRRSTG